MRGDSGEGDRERTVGSIQQDLIQALAQLGPTMSRERGPDTRRRPLETVVEGTRQIQVTGTSGRNKIGKSMEAIMGRGSATYSSRLLGQLLCLCCAGIVTVAAAAAVAVAVVRLVGRLSLSLPLVSSPVSI